jgi:hypothetical protein
LRTRRLWVRTDYLRLYDYCKFHCDDVEKSEIKWRPTTAPSVVITGQPGIGRCFSSLQLSILKHPSTNREKLLDSLCRPPTIRRK